MFSPANLSRIMVRHYTQHEHLCGFNFCLSNHSDITKQLAMLKYKLIHWNLSYDTTKQ